MARNPTPDERAASTAGRLLRALRKTKGPVGGRPRTDAPRCLCGADTLARAQRRAGKDGACPANDGHQAGCPFYREPLIVV